MSIKQEWIDKFIEKLIENNESFEINTTYAYQLATAYFDWGDLGEPAYTVEDAFNMYLNHKSYA